MVVQALNRKIQETFPLFDILARPLAGWLVGNNDDGSSDNEEDSENGDGRCEASCFTWMQRVLRQEAYQKM